MALGDGDVAALFTDLKALGEAVDVVLGGTTTQGILRRNQEVLALDGQQVERVAVLTIKTGSLPGLAAESSLTIGGVAYTVRDPYPEDDAGLTSVVVVP